jgi:hypothetical protein
MADRPMMREATSLTELSPSRVLFVCDRARLRRWQVWLAEALATDGRRSVSFSFIDAEEPLPSSISLLMALERLLYATPSPRASDVVDETSIKGLPFRQGGPYDLAIDFTGCSSNIDASRIVRPIFDGIAGEEGAIAALLDGRLPRLALADDEGSVKELGTCAIEDPAILSRGLDISFSRMGSLLLASLRSLASVGAIGSAPIHVARRPYGAPPVAFIASAVICKARARLVEILGQAPSWSIAWRNSIASPTTETLQIPFEAFTRVPDDGRRYYADPFVLMRGDVAHVFCEEVPFATGKGVISHFTIDSTGYVSSPRPVLEQPYHLSYPFVFESDGEVWMIPESSSARTVELYRAERFPDRWVKHAILLDNVLADDATLFEKEGHFWLFAAVRDWQASSWDALGLYHAEALTGPWVAHPANPVLLDPSAARPAGALFTRNGQPIRPAQDCAQGYGRGLAFCRIDRLDEEGFAQSVLTRITPRTRSIRGVHSFNRAGAFEVIDLFGSAPPNCRPYRRMAS